MSTEQTSLEKNQEDRSRDAWFHFLYDLIWPFFNLIRPLRVIGRENIPEGPVVICPNHTTIGDPFYVVYAFGRHYPVRAMAKIQIMRVPVIGWFLSKAGVFGVDRGHADLKAVKTALKFLKDGNKLLLFPEGTRVKEGETGEAHTGAAMFATRTGVPIVPIYISPKKRLFRKTDVIFGQPYHPEFEGRKPTPEDYQRIADDLMMRIRALGEQA